MKTIIRKKLLSINSYEIYIKKRKKKEETTLMVIFPALYSFSASGSRAGKRENSNPSMSFQSSAWPSRVMSPGPKPATTRISKWESQLHSPFSSCETTRPITAEPNTNSSNTTRNIVDDDDDDEFDGCFSRRSFFIPVGGPNRRLTFKIYLLH